MQSKGKQDAANRSLHLQTLKMKDNSFLFTIMSKKVWMAKCCITHLRMPLTTTIENPPISSQPSLKYTKCRPKIWRKLKIQSFLKNTSHIQPGAGPSTRIRPPEATYQPSLTSSRKIVIRKSMTKNSKVFLWQKTIRVQKNKKIATTFNFHHWNRHQIAIWCHQLKARTTHSF